MNNSEPHSAFDALCLSRFGGFFDSFNGNVKVA